MKKLLFATCLIASAMISSCDDNTESLGLGLVPDGNIVTSKGIVIPVEFSNFIVDEDSVYANSTIAYLGRYTDDMFGNLQSGFLTQLFCLNNFSFEFDKLVKDSISEDAETGKGIYKYKDASCYISLEYTSFFGDSINPNQVEAYILNKDIDGNIMSSVNPADYYDPNNGYIGKVTYTAANTYYDDDERGSTRSVIITLNDSIAQRILNLNHTHPEYFANANSFSKNVIKGLYLKPTSGDGTILYINNSMLNLNFTMYADSSGIYPIKKKEPGYTDQDSTTLYTTSFNSTREVYQVNTFKNVINDNILNDTENTYIKSPAGIFTSVKIPVGKIAVQMPNDTILQIKLTLQAYNQQKGNEYNMDKPENLLLVKKDQVYSFFRNNSLPDNLSSYTTSLDTSTNQYVFNNITALITSFIENARTKNNGVIDENYTEEIVIIPVTLTKEKSSSSGSEEITAVRNELKPQYARLVKQDNKLELSYITIGK